MSKLWAYLASVIPVAGILAAVGAKLPYVLIVWLLMTVDTISGLLAGIANHELKSHKLKMGVIKKSCMFLGVCTAWGVEYIIGSIMTQVGYDGITIPVGLFFCAWIILTEIISIFENLGRAGTPLPKFLLKYMRVLHDFVDKGGDDNGKSGGPNNGSGDAGSSGG